MIHYSGDAINLKSGLRRPNDEGKLHKGMVTPSLLSACGISIYHSGYPCDLESNYIHVTDQQYLSNLLQGCISFKGNHVAFGNTVKDSMGIFQQ